MLKPWSFFGTSRQSPHHPGFAQIAFMRGGSSPIAGRYFFSAIWLSLTPVSKNIPGFQSFPARVTSANNNQVSDIQPIGVAKLFRVSGL
jgi:hypothetical protein